MFIQFREQFALPRNEVFSYFRTPGDWSRLYGLAGEVHDLGDGWFAVPLKSFPFPLVARNTVVEPGDYVRWEFRGFWRGEGEVRFSEKDGAVLLEGYERISLRWLFFLSPIVEKLLLEEKFRGVWAYGWRRLHKIEQRPKEPAAATSHLE